MKYTNEIARNAYVEVANLENFEAVATETLEAAHEWAEPMRFQAQCSDSYAVTREELAAIQAEIGNAEKELKNRKAA